MSAGIENNYLGLGITLDANATITDDTIKGKFSVLNPNYKNSDKSIKTIIESSVDDFVIAVIKQMNWIFIRNWIWTWRDLFVNIEQSNYYEDLETSSTANNIIKKQEGKRRKSSFIHYFL